MFSVAFCVRHCSLKIQTSRVYMHRCSIYFKYLYGDALKVDVALHGDALKVDVALHRIMHRVSQSHGVYL